MTKEQKVISAHNRENAIKFFEWVGLLPVDREPGAYDLHHINPEWKENDIERYIQWNYADLDVLTHSQHTAYHNMFTREYKPHTEETKHKMSQKMKGKHYNCGDDNPMYGKHWKINKETGKRVYY